MFVIVSKKKYDELLKRIEALEETKTKNILPQEKPKTQSSVDKWLNGERKVENK